MRSPSVPPWTKPLAGLAGLLVVWQAVVLTGRIPEDYLPGVPAIAQSLWALFTDRSFWVNEGLTLGRAVAGLLLAAVSGIGAAVLGARFPVVTRALAPLVQVMLSLPPAALVPLSIFALGLGMPLFLFIIWFACVWTIYASATNALSASEPVQLHAARSLGYGRWELLWQVRLPAAVPAIASGVRIAAAGSLMAAVAAEMLAGKDGLGFMLYDSAFALRVPEMFALLGVTGLNGVLLNSCVLRLRRWLAGWHDRLAAMAEH
jgi:NitT/TauT family transport system permease protein